MMLVWLDLETTGLVPQQGRILEVAVGFSTLEKPFDLRTRQSWVCRFDHKNEPYLKIAPEVLEMHTQNGLWDECRASPTLVRDVEQALLVYVKDEPELENKPTLAGDCVGFDHSWLKEYMPTLAKRFHYRYYDVSAVKLFCRSLGMERLVRPEMEIHRAMHDVDKSASHAQMCAAWLAQRGGIALGVS